MTWTLTNTTFLCLMNTIESIRGKKKFYWDLAKSSQLYWLGANMNAEAFLGFNAFNTKKITGTDVIDFVKFRQLVAAGKPLDDAFFAAVLGEPKE
jgi:6-oxo-cyclohex-1-ene-carbonyl-CoA hydrolase